MPILVALMFFDVSMSKKRLSERTQLDYCEFFLSGFDGEINITDRYRGATEFNLINDSKQYRAVFFPVNHNNYFNTTVKSGNQVFKEPNSKYLTLSETQLIFQYDILKILDTNSLNEETINEC